MSKKAQFNTNQAGQLSKHYQDNVDVSLSEASVSICSGSGVGLDWNRYLCRLSSQWKSMRMYLFSVVLSSIGCSMNTAVSHSMRNRPETQHACISAAVVFHLHCQTPASSIPNTFVLGDDMDAHSLIPGILFSPFAFSSELSEKIHAVCFVHICIGHMTHDPALDPTLTAFKVFTAGLKTFIMSMYL